MIAGKVVIQRHCHHLIRGDIKQCTSHDLYRHVLNKTGIEVNEKTGQYADRLIRMTKECLYGKTR